MKSTIIIAWILPLLLSNAAYGMLATLNTSIMGASSGFALCHFYESLSSNTKLAQIKAQEVLMGEGEIVCRNLLTGRNLQSLKVKVTILAPYEYAFTLADDFSLELIAFNFESPETLLGVYQLGQNFAFTPTETGINVEFLIQATKGENQILEIHLLSSLQNSYKVKSMLPEAVLLIESTEEQ